MILVIMRFSDFFLVFYLLQGRLVLISCLAVYLVF